MKAVKTELVKTEKDYYKATKKPTLHFFDEQKYISISGKGEPGGREFQSCIQALYSVAYHLKFSKRGIGKNFKVQKLECLWWMEPGEGYQEILPNKWHWKLMIRIPDFVSFLDVEKSVSEIVSEKAIPDAARITIDSIREGNSLQILHLGPYDRIKETYDIMSAYMEKNGLEHNGPYHEIYLSNPDRTKPENLRTLIRQPFR